MAKRNSTSNSSMPTNPILKGRRWTRSLRNRVLGRWVLVGFSDSPAEAGICVANRHETAREPEVFFPDKGWTWQIDSPQQVIDISFPVKDSSPYSKRKGEWSVEG